MQPQQHPLSVTNMRLLRRLTRSSSSAAGPPSAAAELLSQSRCDLNRGFDSSDAFQTPPRSLMSERELALYLIQLESDSPGPSSPEQEREYENSGSSGSWEEVLSNKSSLPKQAAVHAAVTPPAIRDSVREAAEEFLLHGVLSPDKRGEPSVDVKAAADGIDAAVLAEQVHRDAEARMELARSRERARARLASSPPPPNTPSKGKIEQQGSQHPEQQPKEQQANQSNSSQLLPSPGRSPVRSPVRFAEQVEQDILPGYILPASNPLPATALGLTALRSPCRIRSRSPNSDWNVKWSEVDEAEEAEAEHGPFQLSPAEMCLHMASKVLCSFCIPVGRAAPLPKQA